MYDLSKYNTQELHQQFMTAEPFHHICIDNFLDYTTLKAVENEIRDMTHIHWKNGAQSDIVQSLKIGITDRSLMGEKQKELVDFMNSPEFVRFLQEVTGITDAEADAELLGGGFHQTATGGRLAIHADFNLHLRTGKHRRLNALLYMNEDWNEGYNGELELWDKSMQTCVKKIAPLFNRLVVFRVTDDAFHGHPVPWQGPKDYHRLSLAMYYYTPDRPEHEKAPFHWAAWQKRRGVEY